MRSGLPATRTIAVRISLANPQGLLKPDMFARVTVRTNARPVPTVPTTALVTQSNGGYALFVRDEHGHFIRRDVTIGAENDGRAQVIEGLRAGEAVVVEGALLIDPSASVAL